MNDELQKKLVELLNHAERAGHEAFIFGKEQVPDVIQQLLRWKMAEACVWVVVGLAIFDPAFVLLFKGAKESAKDIGDQNHAIAVGGTIFGAVGVILGLSIFLLDLLILLKIYIAPKVYLLEYLREMLK